MTLHAGVFEEAIDRGVEFLISRRSEDGWWRDFETLAGESDEWVTAYVACCLAHTRGGDRTAQEALELLLSRRRTVGWGYHQDVPSDCDTTAWVCHLIEILEWTVLDEYQRAIRFLAGAIQPSGGVSTYPLDTEIRHYIAASPDSDFSGWTSAHTCVTANVAALQAFCGNARLRSYLTNVRNPNGCWSGYWWEGDAYPTMLSSKTMLTVSEGRTIAERLADQSPFGLACRMKMGDPVSDQLLSQQQIDGGWAASAQLRVPAPFVRDADEGVSRKSLDHHRIYTTATAIMAFNEQSFT